MFDSVEGSNHFAVSNYLDAAASSTFNVVTSSNYSDLPSQLASLGLQKYIRQYFRFIFITFFTFNNVLCQCTCFLILELFKSHEIDLSTFQTLTEADLREIGVTALGARRKMMLFISGNKKIQVHFIMSFSVRVFKDVKAGNILLPFSAASSSIFFGMGWRFSKIPEVELAPATILLPNLSKNLFFSSSCRELTFLQKQNKGT